MTVSVTIHDVMLGLRSNGVGGKHLRQTLWARFGKIYYQGRINGLDLGGTVKFKFKRCYKLQRATQQTTLGHLRIELLCILRFSNSDLFNSLNLKELFDHLPKPLRDFWNNSMTMPEEAIDIEVMTAKEAVQAMTIGDAPESIGIVAESLNHCAY